jgi:hypothetical protein
VAGARPARVYVQSLAARVLAAQDRQDEQLDSSAD